MKNRYTALATAALLASGFATADTTIQSAHFSVTLAEYQIQSMAPISDSGNTVEFSFNYFLPSVATIASWSQPYMWTTLERQEGYETTQLSFNVQDGYRITSITLAGTSIFDPRLATPIAGTYAHEMASAQVSQSVRAGATVGGQYLSLGSYAVDEVAAGPASFVFEGDGMQGDFEFSMAQTAMKQVTGYTYGLASGSPYVYTTQSFLTSGFADVKLIVEVAPVPEPATYGMLLAGLGLLGAAARKRRR